MADAHSPREIAAAWRPERPGRRAVKDLADALVEPDWGGLRVAASLDGDGASFWRDGAEVSTPAELPAALVDAFRAVDAVVEGQLTTMALRSSQGVLPTMPTIERQPLIIPRAIRRGPKDDPYIHPRDYESREAAEEPEILDALERGERHAFVAADLLWLDGQPLDDVPLLERKRHLEAILEPSLLVRVTPFVRPSAVLLLVTWGTLGFGELTYRAANGRYLAGQENPDRVVARPPTGMMGPPTGSAGPR
jgi:hypothetical protein